MFWFELQAYRLLLRFDRCLKRGDFATLYDIVRNCPIKQRAMPADMVERVCGAVDVACAWYWKEVFCLQRSAATACLLRDCSVPAQMVLGVQQMPFKAHAWVEINGQIVNDKPYVSEMYTVLDRC